MKRYGLTKHRRPALRIGGLFLLFLSLSCAAHAQSSSVQTIQLQSKLVNMTLAYNVILPPDYRTSSTTRYPVFYLLHGFGGHYTDWVTRTNVADYAAQYRMIVVTPEGNNGWYTDSVSTATDKYESYILKELIPDVQKRFRTIESRYGRGIAGLSMGGYGALKFGLKSPEMFAFAGSMSGPLAIPTWTEEDLKNLRSIYESVLKTYGPLGSETRKANDIFEITRGFTPARVAAMPYIYLDCGTEDFLVSDNNRFAALLREKKIPHEFRELPGEHSWVYWDRQIREVLRIAAGKLRAGKAARGISHR
ncbi:MAG TPA: alpha/beta hydrolase family protein [Pyrinomonadaceae bacterium]|nr:alpha/beta hydrolase family protein [Pyrinomonadaceae bacterium]